MENRIIVGKPDIKTMEEQLTIMVCEKDKTKLTLYKCKKCNLYKTNKEDPNCYNEIVK